MMGTWHPVRLILFPALLAAGPALAADKPSCEQARHACEVHCIETYAGNDAARAGCRARCASEQAACTAASGVKEGGGWIQEKGQGVGDFLGGFLGRKPQPQPTPPRDLTPGGALPGDTSSGDGTTL